MTSFNTSAQSHFAAASTSVPYINNVVSFKDIKRKHVQSMTPKYSNQQGHDPIMPIKSLDDISRAKEYFLSKPERYAGQNIRDYTIFVLGINVGLRAGDLLHLRISDLLRFNFSKIVIIEQKTRNTRTQTEAREITLSPAIQQILQQYLHRRNLISTRMGIDWSDDSLDTYYVQLINDALKSIRSHEPAFVFSLAQMKDIFRFEPDVEVSYSERDEVYYIRKA